MRVVALRLLESAPFAATEVNSISTLGDAKNCDSIVPGRIEAGGAVVATKEGQQSHGLICTRRYHDRVKGQPAVETVLVLYANIKAAQLGE